VTIDGLPAGVHRVLLENYRLDDTHSNSYTAWKSMGSPQHPTTEQYAALQAAAELQLLDSPKWAEVTNGRVELKMEMPRQSVSLIHVKW